MATITKTKNGEYRVQVRLKGHPSQSATFRTKAQAVAWATKTEDELRSGRFKDTTLAGKTSIVDVLERYRVSVTPKKAPSAKSREESKIKILKAMFKHQTLLSLSPTDVHNFIERRQAEGMKPATINRDLVILHQAIATYVSRGRIPMPHESPVLTVRRELKGTMSLRVMDDRDRRLHPGEQEMLLRALESNPVMQEVVIILLETAMRREELCNARREHIKGKVLEVPWHKTKVRTGKSRFVPLSPLALAAIQRLPLRFDGSLVGLRPDSMTQAFARACRRAGIEDLRLHDLRHEATSRMVERGVLSIPEIQVITGHADLRSFSRYTNLRPEVVAEKLGSILCLS